MPNKLLTLCLITKGDDVLLGMKKRGFGEGLWNGFGGKVSEGETIDAAGRRLIARDAIPSGHKIALVAIGISEPVIKYGSPIGLATAPIAPGDHVHVHNLASTRGRGDLPRPDVR